MYILPVVPEVLKKFKLINQIYNSKFSLFTILEIVCVRISYY